MTTKFTKLNFKIYSKSYSSIYRILRKLDQKLYPAQIARQLSMKEGSIWRYINKLEKHGYIEREMKSNIVSFRLTQLGKTWLKKSLTTNFSIPMSHTKVRHHNLAIKFPIEKDNPKAKWDSANDNLKNWIPKYSRITFPIGMTLKKTPKNIIVYFHKFNTNKSKFMTDYFSWIFKGAYYVYYYLMREMDIQINLFEGQIISEHVANEHPELKEHMDKRKTASVGLERNARSIFPSNLLAKAWLDHSKGNPEIETNDMIYEEKLLLMPEIVFAIGQELRPAITDLTQQVNLHLQTQLDTKETMQEMRNLFKKMMEKMDK